MVYQNKLCSKPGFLLIFSVKKRNTYLCWGGGGYNVQQHFWVQCVALTQYIGLYLSGFFYSVVSFKSALLCPEMLPRQAAHWVLNRADVCLILNLERAVSICLRTEFFPGQGAWAVVKNTSGRRLTRWRFGVQQWWHRRSSSCGAIVIRTAK